MNAFKVEDYITLFINDSIRNDDFYTWNIPLSYYTNRRGDVCTVSCMGGTIEPTASGIHGIVINYVNGAQNAYTTGNDPAILTHGYETIEHGTNKTAFKFTKMAELLVKARPYQITLKITSHDKTTVRDSTNIKGCITLKYTYYNQLETGENLHNQYNKTLS